jgi:ABC-type sugar transport system permease subunit
MFAGQTWTTISALILFDLALSLTIQIENPFTQNETKIIPILSYLTTIDFSKTGLIEAAPIILIVATIIIVKEVLNGTRTDKKKP